MGSTIEHSLEDFYKEQKFNFKGKLSVALIVTSHARKMGLPLDADKLLTDGGGQVLGLGSAPVQAILARHGITKTLAKEAGRTSRGSIGAMRQYVTFLNDAEATKKIDLDAVESFWINKVNIFFAAKPLKVKLDHSQSLRMLVRDLVDQAEQKQKESPGVHYVGAVLQHLVGAKLDCALGAGKFSHNSFSTSDQQSGRSGDFLIDNTVLHITTAPGEAVIKRCEENLHAGQRPILVTTKKGLSVAEGLADNIGISARIDIFEVEQFIALNLYEFAGFEEKKRNVAVGDLVERYNEIVEEFETDPALKIEVQ